MRYKFVMAGYDNNKENNNNNNNDFPSTFESVILYLTYTYLDETFKSERTCDHGTNLKLPHFP